MKRTARTASTKVASTKAASTKSASIKTASIMIALAAAVLLLPLLMACGKKDGNGDGSGSGEQPPASNGSQGTSGAPAAQGDGAAQGAGAGAEAGAGGGAGAAYGTFPRKELTVNGIQLGEGTIDEFALSLGNTISDGFNDDGAGRVVDCFVVRDDNPAGIQNTWISQPIAGDHVGFLQAFREGIVGPRGIVIGTTTKAEALELLKEDPGKESVTYHLDEGESSEAYFTIAFENDLVASFLYVEMDFWSYAMTDEELEELEKQQQPPEGEAVDVFF